MVFFFPSVGLFSEILSKIKSFKVIKEIEDGSQLAVVEEGTCPGV